MPDKFRGEYKAGDIDRRGTEIKRARGRFTLEEEEFIAKNCTAMSVPELAKSLNRTESAIRSFVYRNDLITPDDHKLKHKLYKRPYWKEVQDQLLNHEIDKFIITWTQMMSQFNEDFQYSEELQLKQFILCEILIDRAIRAQTDSIKQIKENERLIIEERAKESPDLSILTLYNSNIQQYNAMAQQASKERVDLAKESQKLFEAIKGSRAQRVTKIGDAHKSFSTALQLLEEPDVRDLIGKDIQLLNLAQQKATMKLYEYFKYDDGHLDSPILNYETYEYLERAGKEIIEGEGGGDVDIETTAAPVPASNKKNFLQRRKISDEQQENLKKHKRRKSVRKQDRQKMEQSE